MMLLRERRDNAQRQKNSFVLCRRVVAEAVFGFPSPHSETLFRMQRVSLNSGTPPPFIFPTSFQRANIGRSRRVLPSNTFLNFTDNGGLSQNAASFISFVISSQINKNAAPRPPSTTTQRPLFQGSQKKLSAGGWARQMRARCQS